MEQISALMDGELEHDEAAGLVPVLKQRVDLREAWSSYHLIGEALRGERCGDCAVVSRVAARLAQEPTVLAPRKARSQQRRNARRWALPGLAAAAAVATVTWMTVQVQESPLAPPLASSAGGLPGGFVVMPTLATGAGTPIAELIPAGFAPAPQPAPQIQLSARELHPYLMAHQPFSPSTAIQGLAPYVRTVTSPVER
jgi:sigma-E factor negative regulatory protein RseA